MIARASAHEPPQDHLGHAHDQYQYRENGGRAQRGFQHGTEAIHARSLVHGDADSDGAVARRQRPPPLFQQSYSRSFEGINPSSSDKPTSHWDITIRVPPKE